MHAHITHLVGDGKQLATKFKKNKKTSQLIQLRFWSPLYFSVAAVITAPTLSRDLGTTQCFMQALPVGFSNHSEARSMLTNLNICF